MNTKRRIILGSAVLFATAITAAAQTVTVTISADVVDVDWQTAMMDDLPGPDGEVSFTEAMIAANNTPGHQTIAFAIPLSDWDMQWLYPGRAVVHTNGGIGIRAFDEVTIDGTTQTAFTGDTNPDGAEVVLYPGTIYLNADNSTIAGIDSTSMNINGSNSHVHDNTGGNVNLFSGTGTLIENNNTGTIKIDRSNNNVVIGNTCQRVRVLGWFGGGQPADSNRIGGPALSDRNFITGYGTWDGEGFPGGTTVQIFDSIGTLIENNWIGTTPDGLAQGNLASTAGVGFEGENHDTVILNNRIAGILGHGIGPHADGLLFGSSIYVGGTGSNITIQGNAIGLNANDEPVLGSVTGISAANYYLGPVQGISIGGAGIGEGNEIAGHLTNGITVSSPVVGVRVSGNSIHDNESLGIDLVTAGFVYGATLNDLLDTDSGANGLQNFPVITGADRQGGALQVVGSLNSSAFDDFTIEFFASPDCDASGFGEGEMYVGSIGVSTDASGNAHFDELLAATFPDGWVLTSTATLEPTGSTSEFSQCVAVTGQGLAGDLDGDGDVDLSDLAILLADYPCTGGSCPGDLDGDGDTDLSDLALLLANYGG